MYKIFKRYSHVFTFVFLQGLSILLMKQYKNISDNFIVSSFQYCWHQLHTITYGMQSYFTLHTKNKQLQKENLYLKDLLIKKNINSQDSILPLNNKNTQYIFTTANILFHTIHRTKNYIIINKGKKQGIKKNMGVITYQGVVGIVSKVFEQQAIVTSILHTNLFLSAKIASSDTIGSLKWFGKKSNEAHLLYVPRHLQIILSEQVVTSGYSTIFPPNLPIGTINHITLPDHASFYSIRINLHTPFHKLKWVYILKKRNMEDYKKLIENLEE